MYLVYLDESGQTGLKLDDKNQPVFVLGALIIEESLWLPVEKNISALFEEYFPGKPTDLEIHTSDIRSGRGYFRTVPSKQRTAFRDACLKILAENGLKLIYRGISKHHFKLWIEKNLGTGVALNPHVVAFPLVARVIDDYLTTLGPTALGILISDENRQVTADIEKSIKLLRGTEGTLKLNRVIEKGFFIDSKTSRLLQMADLCVFYARKRYEQEHGTTISEVDKTGVNSLEPLIHNGNEAFQDTMEWLISNQKKGRPGDNPKVG